MDWLAHVGFVWFTSLAWIGGLVVVFLLLTRFTPCNPGQSWWADPRAAVTDLVYWLVLPLVMQVARVLLLVGGVLLLYGAVPENTDWVVRRWPIWVQIVAVLLIQDVILYWLHRLFHTRAGWRFHAVHHSPEVLDWTSTQRFHPVNAILEFAVADVAVLLMGFSPDALVLIGPLNMAYSVMVHANLNWTFGPLRYVLVSPVYHRWHHTAAEEGRDRNFASTFPFLDLLFGTCHMPVGKRPEVYGTADGDVPRGFVGQTVYPFRGAGAWARRHPVMATTGGLAVAAGIAFGVMKLTQPVEPTPTSVVEVTMAKPAPAELPPLPARGMASSVAVSVHRSQVFLGGADGTLTIRGADGGEQAIAAHMQRANALAVSPDDALIVTGGGDGTARVWSAESGQPLRTLRGHGAAVMSVAVAADGWVTTGSADGVVRVWDATGELVGVHRTGVPAPVHAVAVAAGGGRVVAAQLSTAFLWDAPADKTTPLTGQTALAYAVALSPDGTTAVTAGYDGRVKVWDAGGRCTSELLGHDGPVYAVAFTRDGQRLVTGGKDGTVRVWRTGGELVRELGGHTGLVFAVSADDAGRRIAAAGKDGTTSVWQVPDGEVVPASATAPGK